MYFIDMDDFQRINLKYGKSTGDVLLKRIGSLLQQVADSNYITARLGSDAFAIFHINCKTNECIEKLIAKLQYRVSIEHQIDNHSIDLSMTIGVAITSDHGSSCDQVFRCAEIALHYAKKSARGEFLVYKKGMRKSLQQQDNIEHLTRLALRNSYFEIHYQPFYCAKSLELRGFEALIRLPSTDGGYISPDVFIPIAEQISLIDDIGKWVLNEAMTFAYSWPEDLVLSVNLSVRQFEDNNLITVVKEALAQSQFSANRLELEITEGLIMHDTENSLKQLSQLKQLGIAISMDDFGTGYSSLAYLWRFPFDKIKIDQGFLNNYENNPDKIAVIVSTIISLARSLDMKITAEGIDTIAKQELLQNAGSDFLQGYLLAKPLTSANVNKLLSPQHTSTV